VKELQKGWIGGSMGHKVIFRTDRDDEVAFECFTTKLETIMGVKFLAISPHNKIFDVL
jgi:leucyl-tRNA synthetase